MIFQGLWFPKYTLGSCGIVVVLLQALFDMGVFTEGCNIVELRVTGVVLSSQASTEETE